MQSAWLLPEDIADVLPHEARHIETLRRQWLDRASRCGFELVIPPMIEYLDSLLSGTGHSLDLQTFKLIDQLTGRTLGLRADMTPQVARIDAHLLNRQGVARLCYCGPIIHTRADGPQATREPLQFGAEIYGHAGLEADLEIIDLALDGLGLHDDTGKGLRDVVVDLADARIVRSLLGGLAMDAAALAGVIDALTHKDAGALVASGQGMPADAQRWLGALMDLYGDHAVLDQAHKALPSRAPIAQALADLAWLGEHLRRAHPTVKVSFDLSDVGGHAYYTGARFAIYAAGRPAALVRGGRYDEVGAVFGRNRPAVGFSLDLKSLASVTAGPLTQGRIVARWSEDVSQRAAIQALRAQGETVQCILPGDEGHDACTHADRELIQVAGRWVVQALPLSDASDAMVAPVSSA